MNCPSSLPTAKGRMVGYDENANETIKRNNNAAAAAAMLAATTGTNGITAPPPAVTAGNNIEKAVVTSQINRYSLFMPTVILAEAYSFPISIFISYLYREIRAGTHLRIILGGGGYL